MLTVWSERKYFAIRSLVVRWDVAGGVLDFVG